MAEFKGHSEKFRVNLVHSDGNTERVIIQVGLDGLKVLNANDNRMMRSYELSHISRWQSRGSTLVLYTRTPVDVEERQTTVQGDDNTIRNALDTLTCCCMQLAELLQSKQTETAQETANNLHALVVGNGKKKTTLPSADDVEYWKSPDKSGWLQSQGDHIKSWRKRWFVLKQGYLFRFKDSHVNESNKPRGVVDLSKIQDVKALPGRSNTIQLKTTTGGMVSYMADSETEVVEWISAIEAAMAKIHKLVAGIEEEAPAKPKPAQASKANEWAKQLEQSFGNQTSSSSAPSSKATGSTLVNVVGYDSIASGGGRNASAGGHRDQPSTYRNNSPYNNLNREYSGGYTSIGNIAGANTIPAASTATSDLDLNYGGGGAGYLSHSQPSQPAYTSQAAQAAYNPHQGSNNNYGYYQQPAPAPLGSAPPTMSLIDQVPNQQPAYPYFQQHASAPQQAPPPGPPPMTGSWQIHYTAEGRPYYFNAMSGMTQWDTPAGYAM